jgi:hypothetical protein
MTNTATPQALCERIEQLVQEYISATRIAAQAAMDRAFASTGGEKVMKRRQDGAPRPSRRRPSAEVAALGEQLYAAVRERPGETMTGLAPVVGRSARDLQRPMTLLKRAGRVRSVGRRQGTRYFPKAGEREASA